MGLTPPLGVVNGIRTTILYVDAMTEKRQSAALQRGPGESMAIGEFGGAATLSDGSGTLLATPMYWFYEMGHAALNPARAFADATVLQDPSKSAPTPLLWQVHGGHDGFVRALDPPISPARMGHRLDHRRG